MLKVYARGLFAAFALSLAAAPAAAQIRQVDPNDEIDADLIPIDEQERAAPAEAAQPSDAGDMATTTEDFEAAEPAAESATTPPPAAAVEGETYAKGDLIGAAEGVFGQGAQGLAEILEDILKEQGQPTAYITGEEASGAFVVGLRYGSGVLHHKVEGNRKVFWTGPSVGFDVGGNAAKSFVLVYNLQDSQDLYRRYPQGEGAAYFVGGFTASYLRRGDIVLIPVRLGAGLRLGANIGYMKFSERGRWVPF